MYVDRNGKQVKLIVDQGQSKLVDGSNTQIISSEEARQLLTHRLESLVEESLKQLSRANEGHVVECIYRDYAERSSAINRLCRMLDTDGPVEEHSNVKIEFVEEPKSDFNNMILRTPRKVTRTRIKSVKAGPEYQIGG